MSNPVTLDSSCSLPSAGSESSARSKPKGSTQSRQNADKRLHYKLPNFFTFHGIFFKVKQRYAD